MLKLFFLFAFTSILPYSTGKNGTSAALGWKKQKPLISFNVDGKAPLFFDGIFFVRCV